MKTARFLTVLIIFFLAIGVQPITTQNVDANEKKAETNAGKSIEGKRHQSAETKTSAGKSKVAKKPGKINRGLLKAEKKINKAITKTGEFGKRTLKKVKNFSDKDIEKAEQKGKKGLNKVKELGKKGIKKTKKFGEKAMKAIDEFFE